MATQYQYNLSPGIRVTYPGYGYPNKSPEVYLQQNISNIVNSLYPTIGPVIGPTVTNSNNVPYLIENTPTNSIYSNLNVQTNYDIANYDTNLTTFVTGNSVNIKNAKYIDRAYITYNNSSPNTNYNNVFPNLEVVFGYLGVRAGAWTNGDMTTIKVPNLINTSLDNPSNVGTNNITLEDFPKLREVHGDILIITDYLNNIPKFPNLELCGSLNIISTLGQLQSLSITPQHFPKLKHIQKTLRMINIVGLEFINGFNALTTLGSFFGPLSNPVTIDGVNGPGISDEISTYIPPSINTNDNYAGYVTNTLNNYNALEIMSNGFASGITFITGFNSLVVVNGHINISANNFKPTGTNNYIHAFQNLLYCQNIFLGKINNTIFVNQNLHQIIAFDKVTSIGSLFIADNFVGSTLYRIVGFKKLKHVNQNITIGVSGNETPVLSNIDGFYELQSCDNVSIYVYNLLAIPALAVLQRASNQTSIYYYN